MKNEETLFDSDLLHSLMKTGKPEGKCPHSLAISQGLRALQDRSEAASQRIMDAWPLEHGTEHLHAVLHALEHATEDSWLVAYVSKEHLARSVAHRERLAELLERFFDEVKAGLANSAGPVREGGGQDA